MKSVEWTSTKVQEKGMLGRLFRLREGRYGGQGKASLPWNGFDKVYDRVTDEAFDTKWGNKVPDKVTDKVFMGGDTYPAKVVPSSQGNVCRGFVSFRSSQGR